jgi:hypothetical protein
MGINDISVCVCIYVWIKRQEYVTIEQLYIEPLVYKNKSIYIYVSNKLKSSTINSSSSIHSITRQVVLMMMMMMMV